MASENLLMKRLWFERENPLSLENFSTRQPSICETSVHLFSLDVSSANTVPIYLFMLYSSLCNYVIIKNVTTDAMIKDLVVENSLETNIDWFKRVA